MPVVIAHSPDCPGGNCPTTYAHPEPGMSYLQGYAVTDPAVIAEYDLPAGDVLVAVPSSLLADHMRLVRAESARAAGVAIFPHPAPGMSYVRGHAITDPAVLAEFAIPTLEVLVAIRDSALCSAATDVRDSDVALAVQR